MRKAFIFVWAALIVLGFSKPGFGSESGSHSYVANTSPPDAFLALKQFPSPRGPRLMAMANGTQLDVLARRSDGWWYVQVFPSGEQGWALSGTSQKAYILCCTTDGDQQSNVANSSSPNLTDLTCDQLWFGRNSIFRLASYCFKTPRATRRFGNAGCLYTDVSAVRLTGDNEALVKTIQDAEREKGCTQ